MIDILELVSYFVKEDQVKIVDIALNEDLTDYFHRVNLVIKKVEGM